MLRVGFESERIQICWWYWNNQKTMILV